MIIIGEKINGGSKNVEAAILNKDSQFIQELAKKQVDAGANIIDINAGSKSSDEPQKLQWLVNVLQEVCDTPFSLDSQNRDAISLALKESKRHNIIINSISGEKEKFSSFLPLILQYNTSVIALCMDDSGLPETIDERLAITDRLLKNLSKEGIQESRIFIDPLVRPVVSGSHHGVDALETIRKLKSEFGNIQLVCGISNISFGIPGRNLMNQAFLVSAMVAGLDAAILNPLDRKLMSLFYATNTLIGKDEFCMDYQMKFREGLLEM